MFTLHIVAVSSWSSRLGYAIVREFADDYDASHRGLNVFLVAKNNSNAPKHLDCVSFSPENILQNKENSCFNLVLRARLKFLSLFLLILCLFASFFSLVIPLKLVVWQPRPYWILNKRHVSILNMFGPRLTFIQKFCGDGFLQLCLSDSPPWLRKSKKHNSVSPEFLKNSIYYYMYSIQSLSKESCPSLDLSNYSVIRLSPETVNSSLERACNSLSNSQNLNTFISDLSSAIHGYSPNEIVIFPTTTFYETRRSTLSSEILLYKSFLENNNYILPGTPIFFKPHPNSKYEKISELIALSKCIHDGHFADILSKYTSLITHLPLEVLAEFIQNAYNCQLNIVLASTAGVSLSILRPKFKYIPAFGTKLIHQHLVPEYVDSRIDQEELIVNFLNQ